MLHQPGFAVEVVWLLCNISIQHHSLRFVQGREYKNGAGAANPATVGGAADEYFELLNDLGTSNANRLGWEIQ